MTPDEHQSAAEKLVNAVKNNTNGAYDEWTSSGDALKSADARAAFVQKHAALPEKPTQEDLDAIQQHVDTSLRADVAEIQQQRRGSPAVGLVCLTGGDGDDDA
jgi:hypothetical protein